jgi:prepilin-type processing-associated H-X9-DG protein
MKRIITIIFLAFVATLAYSVPVLVPMNNPKEYARLSEDKQILLKGDYKTGKEDTIVVFSKMRNVPLNAVEAFRFSPAEDKLLLKSGNEYYVYRLGTNRAEKLSNNGPQIAPIFSNDGNNIAFIRKNNIFLKRLQFETEVQVTTDGSAEVTNGSHSQKITHAESRHNKQTDGWFIVGNVSTSEGNIAPRHGSSTEQGTLNLAFADGHVGSISNFKVGDFDSDEMLNLHWDISK